MKRLLICSLLLTAVWIMICERSAAQDILLDDFEQCAGLICFRSINDANAYYYLPNQPSLAIGENDKPEFSFLKYVRNIPSGNEEGGIQEAAGGGVVHFLVTYQVPVDVVNEAQRELRELYEDAELKGPVLFRSGSFALVTSIADEDGRFTNTVVGVGKAPLIEGAKAAVSIDLTPEGASLLWESFKMENPDISIVFDMEISGFRRGYQASMEVDFDQVYQDRDFAVGGQVYMFGVDIEDKFQELQQSGAIKLTTRGENASMQAIIDRAHSKLLEIMFSKVEEKAVQAQGSGPDPLQSLANLIKGKGSVKNLGKTVLPIAAHGRYKVKELERSGKAVFDFNHSAQDSLNIVMAGNIGPVYAEWGDDTSIFNAVNLDDPVFRQREVFVTIDGRSEEDFAEYINFVTVQLRKTHESGEETFSEVVIDGESFKKNNNRFRMVYGWKGDTDKSEWLRFHYRSTWNFRQGISFESDWQEADNFVVNVSPPYEYRRISFEADPETFRQREVRHALVKFFYSFYGKEIEKQIAVRVRDDVAVAHLEYVCEAGNYDYGYEITWYLRGGKRMSQDRRTDSSEILYVDELPEEIDP